jgi:hypothetical protein
MRRPLSALAACSSTAVRYGTVRAFLDHFVTLL